MNMRIPAYSVEGPNNGWYRLSVGPDTWMWFPVSFARSWDRSNSMLPRQYVYKPTRAKIDLLRKCWIDWIGKNEVQGEKARTI